MHAANKSFGCPDSATSILEQARNALMYLSPKFYQANCDMRRQAARTLHEQLRTGLITEADWAGLAVSCEGNIWTSTECIMQRLSQYDMTQLDQNESIANRDVVTLLELIQGAIRGSLRNNNSTMPPCYSNNTFLVQELTALRSLVFTAASTKPTCTKILSAIDETLSLSRSQSSVCRLPISCEKYILDAQHLHGNRRLCEATRNVIFEEGTSEHVDASLVNNGTWSTETPSGVIIPQNSYTTPETQSGLARRQIESRQTFIIPPFYAEGQKPENSGRIDPLSEDMLFRIESLLLSCLNNLRARLWSGQGKKEQSFANCQTSQISMFDGSFYCHSEQRKVLEVEIRRVIKATSYLIDVTLALQPFEIFLQSGYSSIFIHLLDILSVVASHCMISHVIPEQSRKNETTQLELGIFENMAVQILLFLQSWSKKNNLRFQSREHDKETDTATTRATRCGLEIRSFCTPKSDATFSYGGASLAIYRVALLLMNAHNAQIRYLATKLCLISFTKISESNLQPENEIRCRVDSLTADRLSLALVSLNHAIDKFKLPISCLPALFGKHLNHLRPLMMAETFDLITSKEFTSEWVATTLRSRSEPSSPRISVSKQLLDVIQIANDQLLDEAQHSQMLCMNISSARSTKEMSSALFSAMIEFLLFPEIKIILLETSSEWISAIERIILIHPSSSKDYDLLSSILMFVSELADKVSKQMLEESLIPCAILLFNERSHPDSLGNVARRAYRNTQCAMICLLHGLLTCQSGQTEICNREILRVQLVERDVLATGLIALCTTYNGSYDQATPRLHFGALGLLKQLLQLECLCNSEITRIFESLAQWLQKFQKTTQEGLICLDPAAYDGLLLLRIASSILRKNMVEVTQCSSNIEASWLIFLLQDVNPTVKCQGLGIASDLFCRCIATRDSGTSPYYHVQITDLTMKLATNRSDCQDVQDASLNALSFLIIRRDFVDAEGLVKAISRCRIWGSQTMKSFEYIEKGGRAIPISDNFASSRATLSSVIFLRSVIESTLGQTVESELPFNISQHLHSNGVLMQICTLVDFSSALIGSKQTRYEGYGSNSSVCLDLCDMVLQSKAIIFQLFTAIVCASNDGMTLEDIFDYNLLQLALQFLTCQEDKDVSSRPSYLYCFSSVCRCLVPLINVYSSKRLLSTSCFTPQAHQSMGAVIQGVFFHDREMNTINASKAALVLLQTFNVHSPNWLHDLSDENSAELLEELTALFQREVTHRSATDSSLVLLGNTLMSSCAHTIVSIWKLQDEESSSEKVLTLALTSAREISLGFMKSIHFFSQSCNKAKTGTLSKIEDSTHTSVIFSNQTNPDTLMCSLTILLSLLRFKAVRKEIFDPPLLVRMMSFFHVRLEEQSRAFFSVDPSGLRPPMKLGDKLLETFLVILCTMMWNEPTLKPVIAGSEFARKISDIALDRSSCITGFSSSLLEYSFAALRLLAIPDSSGKGNPTIFPTCSKVVASLNAWITLLKSSNKRKDMIRSESWNARIVGGLKLLAAITLDVEGRRNAFFVWNDFEHLMNLITDCNRFMSNDMLRWSLMLLRNLSLDRSRKPMVISHQAWMDFLIEQCTSAQDGNVEEAAFSALWCLLHQSQKAVSIVKKYHQLDETLARTTQVGCTKARRAVQILIQT